MPKLKKNPKPMSQRWKRVVQFTFKCRDSALIQTSKCCYNLGLECLHVSIISNWVTTNNTHEWSLNLTNLDFSTIGCKILPQCHKYLVCSDGMGMKAPRISADFWSHITATGWVVCWFHPHPLSLRQLNPSSERDNSGLWSENRQWSWF